MTTPDDVRASLLRGDSRDGCARWKVADQVREVVEHACDQVALAALAVGSPQLPHTQQAATRAASAVVLASDLRAPDDRPNTPAQACPTCGYDCSSADHAEVMAQGSRASTLERLANVERLLAEAMGEGRTQTSVAAADDGEVAEALAIVRALLGGQ